jgi:hypothetical protein
VKPSELAQRIAAMDWSGCDLQHQLAVVAACETLNGLDAPASLPNNVVMLRPTHRTVRLVTLDGRELASADFCGPESAWSWIADTAAREVGCAPDDVHCLEDPGNGGDLVTVDGLPVYRIVHGARPN